MEREELLKPRYKLVADYPGNMWEVGSIFPINFANFDKYPSLFKKLEWWEDRRPEEMPEYVKHKYGKVVKLLSCSSYGYCMTEESGGFHNKLISDYSPVTEQEYNNQTRPGGGE